MVYIFMASIDSGLLTSLLLIDYVTSLSPSRTEFHGSTGDVLGTRS